MGYKLLLTDLDGTLIPELGMPPKPISFSPKLTHAIQKAKLKVLISLCTGRDKQTVLEVINKLNLTSSHVIEGGAKIIDSKGNDLWAKYITEDSAVSILKIIQQKRLPFSIIVDGVETMNKFPKKNFEKISCILVYALNNQQIEYLKSLFSKYNDIAYVLNSDRIKNSMFITDQAGTKARGIEGLFRMIKVKKAQSIGVGNGENDIDLLLSCGLKVAMGNSVKSLKDIADYVAPTVYNDGLIDVIEKFCL